MNRVEAAARALVGVRFRLHGRGATHGLDCVGLVAAATGRAAPTGKGGRSGDEAREAAQLHLAIRVSDGIVHADAGLRRVAWRPGAPPWPVLGYWKGEG